MRRELGCQWHCANLHSTYTIFTSVRAPLAKFESGVTQVWVQSAKLRKMSADAVRCFDPPGRFRASCSTAQGAPAPRSPLLPEPRMPQPHASATRGLSPSPRHTATPARAASGAARRAALPLTCPRRPSLPAAPRRRYLPADARRRLARAGRLEPFQQDLSELSTSNAATRDPRARVPAACSNGLTAS